MDPKSESVVAACAGVGVERIADLVPAVRAAAREAVASEGS
ncbi:hypothetical protein [Streptomyces sp. NPDC093261]